MVVTAMPAVMLANTQATASTFTFPFRFAATDLNGNQVTQDSLGQKEIFFVYYWTTTCWACVEGLPDLTRLANEFGDRVGFLSVLGDFGAARERALEVTRNAGIPFITIDANNSDLSGLMPLLDSGFVPTSVIIGADGRVIGEQMVGGDFNMYSQALRSALQQSSPSTPVFIPPSAPIQQSNNVSISNTLDIIRIMETPIAGTNNAQLTLATGTDVNEVWIRFAEPARYRRGTLVSENANMRIWEIDFQPISRNPHDVEVFANREYVVFGATRQVFRIAHNPSPFLHPVFDHVTNELLPIVREYILPSSLFPFRFSATDLHGNRVTEASLGEKALFFVHITATWCGPCNDAAPAVAAMSQEFGDRVGFISLLEDFNENTGRNRALQWSRNYRENYIIVDRHLSVLRPIINLLPPNDWGYPTSILIDGNGNVVDRRSGASSDINQNINSLMSLLDSGFVPTSAVISVDGSAIGGQIVGSGIDRFQTAIEDALGG